MTKITALDCLKNKLTGAFDSAASRDSMIGDLNKMVGNKMNPICHHFLKKTDALMAYATRNPDELEIIDPAMDKITSILRNSQGIHASGDFLLAARSSLAYWNSLPEITDIYCAIYALDKKLTNLLIEDVKNSSPDKDERSQFFLENWIGHYQSLKNQNMKGAIAAVIVDLCGKSDMDINASARLEAIKFVMMNPTTEFDDFLNAEASLVGLAREFRDEGDIKSEKDCMRFWMASDFPRIGK